MAIIQIYKGYIIRKIIEVVRPNDEAIQCYTETVKDAKREIDYLVNNPNMKL